MRNITLRQLRVFTAVAQQRSFTRAARELHLTQPAVSQQIRLLETEVDLRLFEHIGRRIQLTAAGEELLRYATQTTNLLREAGEALAALRGLKRGVLKLGAVSTAKYFAPSLLATFRSMYPEVTIRFPVGNREEIIQLLAANELDLAIMGRPPRELQTIAAPFAKHPLVMIAAPGHPLATKRRIPLKRLSDENFLIREEGSGTRAALEQVFEDHGLGHRTSMEINSNETIKQAVMVGMGISFISMHTVSLELATRKLVTLDVVGMPLLRDWYVIHLREKQLAPIAAAFRAFLLESGAAIIGKVIGAGAQPRRRSSRKA
jgi:DNA-binding transcriptional LysR family regulator